MSGGAAGAAGAAVLDREGPRLDLWLALLAGDRVWITGDSDPTTREQAVSAFMLVALVITLLVQLVALSGRVDPFDDAGLTASDRRLVALVGAGTVAASALAVRPVALLLGRHRASPRFGPSVIWRGLAYLMLIVGTAALLSRSRFLGAIPLGLLGGSDAVLTLWAVGIAPAPLRWAKSFLFSTVHFGVLGAMLAAVWVESGNDAVTALLGIYVAMWLGVVVALAAVVGMHRLSELVDVQQAAKEQAVRDRERRLRAHWLHDDVLSEVRLSTLRLQGADDVDAARVELRDLDHRLRLRQLDEVIRGGATHLYEILQPHLRRIQSLGVTVSRVPPLELTDRTVDEDAAELFHRAVSVLVSNSLNAGASRIGIGLRPLGTGRIELSVSDDAGGFDLAAAPPGRGLAQLRHDLGDGAVRRRDLDSIDGGSVVSVVIPLRRDAVDPPEAPA